MPAPAVLPSLRSAACPFHSGLATLDLLLAELDPENTEIFDAALDLRSLCNAATDAEACIAQLFRVRHLLAGGHYLAFYRVRSWARHAFRLEIRADRREPWRSIPLPLDVARLDELVNSSLATLANADGEIPPMARLRFRFAQEAQAAR